MELTITQKRDNPLLERTEVYFTIAHEKSGTPQRAEIRKAVAGALGGQGGIVILDWARAVARRAERRVVALHEVGFLGNPEVLKYLNRLADLLFILARHQEALDGKGAVTWRGKDHKP